MSKLAHSNDATMEAIERMSLDQYEVVPFDSAEMAVMGILMDSYAMLDRIKASPLEFSKLAKELHEASVQLYRASLMARGVTNVVQH